MYCIDYAINFFIYYFLLHVIEKSGNDLNFKSKPTFEIGAALQLSGKSLTQNENGFLQVVQDELDPVPYSFSCFSEINFALTAYLSILLKEIVFMPNEILPGSLSAFIS